MKLTLGFSPCPNDTFIFNALVNRKIDTHGVEFEMVIEDVEQLNRKMLNAQLDLSKISFATYPQISPDYKILSSGSAMGKDNGPLIISKSKIYPNELKDVKIAIPGVHTTANLLLDIAFPEAKNKKEYLFSDIEEAILNHEVDAGVIIHETRFTYHQKGLKKIIDLGEYWQRSTGLPLPLGGIVIRRSIDTSIQQTINSMIKSSIEYARQKPLSAKRFVKKHARELNDEVIARHITLYVNDFSINMREVGRKALKKLFNEGMKSGCFAMPENDIFVDEL